MDPIRITSASNSIIKEIRRLHDKKGRQKSKAILLEGTRLVTEALASEAKIRYFVLSDSFYEKSDGILSEYPDTKAFLVPDELFVRIGETKTPQGVMSAVELPDYDSSMILGLRRLIVLENVQDPGNLGAIIRTADACGLDGVLLSRDSADPYNPKVIRSTMGSIFHLPVIVAPDIYEALEGLKRYGVKVAAADIRNAVPCWEADLSGNTAIVVGNEGSGISERMLQLADLAVMIPMPGKAESLNASAAASILLYESMRQVCLNKL